METISEQACFGGIQGVYRHQSEQTATPMSFAVFQPAQAKQRPLAVLWYLSGLTCTWENFTVKAGAQRYAAEHGLILVAPDTSPRGANIAGEDDAYDFGSGAGFYVDATQSPWDKNYRMYSYISEELPAVVFNHFAADPSRQGISGHSMGGHGALMIGLRNPERYQSISAFSPICAPTQCTWGQKAFTGYLGENQQDWQKYDATQLIKSGAHSDEILIDQGADDEFLTDLNTELFRQVCQDTGQPLNLRMQAGYDHSYYFIASFIGEHIAFHANRLGANTTK